MSAKWQVKIRVPGWLNIDALLTPQPVPTPDPNPGATADYTVWLGEEHGHPHVGAVLNEESTVWSDTQPTLNFGVHLLGVPDGVSQPLSAVNVTLPNAATDETTFHIGGSDFCPLAIGGDGTQAGTFEVIDVS